MLNLPARRPWARSLTTLATATALVASAGLATSGTAGAATAGPAAYGTNVALASAGGTVTASGSEGNGSYGWTPPKAIDGITSGPSGQNTSRWSSNYADDAWIAVRLAQPTRIDHVAIYWETACAAEYRLQVSTDGTTWVDATATVRPTCGTKDTQTLGAQADPATAYQHVRMQTIKRTAIGGQYYGVSLWELEVWDGAEPVPAPALPLVPKPLRVDQPQGAEPYAAGPASAVVASGDAVGPATLLAERLRRATGWAFPVAATPPAGSSANITLTIDPAATYPAAGTAGTDEAYRLVSSDAGVTITGKTAHGVFNGTQTLRQLLPAWAGAGVPTHAAVTAPAVTIEDAPRFGYRGVMIDVARSFQTVDEIKAQIDLLALAKLSTLHLHLADDQGWRIEITNDGKAPGDPIDYSRLTSVSGRTAMSTQGYRSEVGRTGFYTQEQYRDIVAYARARFVDVVPEVDIPGHTNAALHAIPQLNTARSLPRPDATTGVVPWNGSGAVGYSALDEQLELSYVFVEHVFKQLAELSGSDYVHIGGDESHDMGHTRYVDFVTKAVPRVRAASGVGTIGWSEYAEAGLSQGPGYWDGSVVQYWVGSGDWVRDFVAKGGKAIVSSASGAYLDQKYDATTPIGLTWACSGSCDFDRYYAWDPTTTVAGGVAEAGVLGVEGPLWSETVRGGDQAQYLVLPRALAVLETGWSTAANKDAADFARRLGALGSHLTVASGNFHESFRATWRATATGTDLVARTGVQAAWPVGLVAAPGTKLSADGASILPDTVTTDGDPASASSVTAPVTARLVCGAQAHPVVFRADQRRDNLHGAGVYTATVSAAFAEAGACTFETSGGLQSGTPVALTVDAAAPLPAQPFTPTDPATIAVGGGASTVRAGDWTAFALDGFEDRDYVTLTAGSRSLGTVRTDGTGRFAGHVPLPADLLDGATTFTATQGSRTATTTRTVGSSVTPLPDLIDQQTIEVAGFDSQETVGENGAAANAVDGNPSTIWHTQWQGAAPPFPHHITLDLVELHDVSGLAYLRRQNADNGVFKDYEIYVSEDNATWGTPVAKGAFTAAKTPQNVTFTPKRGRYVKLVGLSSLAGNAFGGAAEINVGGRPVPNGVAPKVAVTAAPGCDASAGTVRVEVTNTGTAPTDVVVSTPHGEKAFTGVAPGAKVAHVFPAGSRIVAAGSATVVARTNEGGIARELTEQAAYDGADCRAQATLDARLAKDVIRVGQSGTVNVTLTGAEGLPTGTVTVVEGSRTLATGTVDARGNVSLALPKNLVPGRHVLDVTYSGNPTYRPASAVLVLTVR